MEFETLQFEVQDSVAHIVLNRPSRRNALTGQMCKDLMSASLICDEEQEIRCVLLRGSGDMFCAGGDLNEFRAAGSQLGRHLKEMTTYMHAACSNFARMDAPLITAVHGFAAGAGLSFAVAGDLVLAAESARFTMAYTRIGMTPDAGATYFLPRIIGMKRTLDWAMNNHVLTATEAQEWGLVTRIVADDALVDEAVEAAERLARGPTRAFGAVKQLVYGSFEQSLETQMELERRAIVTQSMSADAREGMRAFLEKREAQFEGK